MLNALDRGLAAVEALLAALVAGAMLGVMVVIVCDVFARYVLGRPIPWVYDVVSIYFVNMALYLVASETLRRGGHIALDLNAALLPRGPRVAAQWLGWIAVDAVLLAAATVVGAAALRSALAGEVKPGQYDWPVWLEKGVVALGLALLAARVTLELARTASTGFRREPFEGTESPGPAASARSR